MADINRTIQRLDHLRRFLANYDRDFFDKAIDKRAYAESLGNAIELLREKEPVKAAYDARINWYRCGGCKKTITSGMHCRGELIPAYKVNFCSSCGRPVEWTVE